MANDTSTPPASPQAGTSNRSPPPLPDPSTVGQIPPRTEISIASVGDAVKNINADSFTNLHKMPCARQTFLTGIASGFAFGGVKLVLRYICDIFG
ncbi:hypothetical protein ABW20_dc0108434 [Dactylellina cionopaga]|nr:hypothetical protein ABW20_dc0108434 [Dactylellina cionopaga]